MSYMYSPFRTDRFLCETVALFGGIVCMVTYMTVTLGSVVLYAAWQRDFQSNVIII